MSDVITARGRNGQITFNGKVLTITREGVAARLSQGRGRKDVPLSQISGVQLRPNSIMRAGYFQVTIPGGIEQRDHANPAADENTVVFGKKAQPEFEALRDAVLSAL